MVRDGEMASGHCGQLLGRRRLPQDICSTLLPRLAPWPGGPCQAVLERAGVS